MLARVRKRYYANRHTPSADGQCQQDRTSEKFKRQARLLDLMEWNGYMCGRGDFRIFSVPWTQPPTGQKQHRPRVLDHDLSVTESTHLRSRQGNTKNYADKQVA
ncbi:hypothetical protein TNCV_3058071 [Trichonephila clavipes]|nr:hypothetical protein TNCV_3058071 [Trichonephila clavipes]